MELYRVLLVDDEEDIREGISRKMDWLGLGFSLVGEAANGQDALELAESLRPDVILTDIKMPFMDGLELCRILTDRLPAARFVVFSGFDAFEYAKQAIQMNVVEYILKPINADELSAVKRGDAERGCSFEGVELLRDLNGEFTGRGEDQRLRVSASACDGVDDGNAERGSFSGSGLSLSDHIFFPFEQQGDREFLNGGGFFKSFLLKSGDHAFGDTECAEFFEIVHGYLLSAVILC